MKGCDGKDAGRDSYRFGIMIGIDLWDKRVGIAVLVQGIAIPYDIVSRVEIIRYLRKLIREKWAKVLVVGLPYDLYWLDTKQLDKTNKFIEKLKDIFPEQEVVGYDERFTTIEADATMKKDWNKTKNTYKDDISAALILEWYVHKNTSH